MNTQMFNEDFEEEIENEEIDISYQEEILLEIKKTNGLLRIAINQNRINNIHVDALQRLSNRNFILIGKSFDSAERFVKDFAALNDGNFIKINVEDKFEIIKILCSIKNGDYVLINNDKINCHNINSMIDAIKYNKVTLNVGKDKKSVTLNLAQCYYVLYSNDIKKIKREFANFEVIDI